MNSEDKEWLIVTFPEYYQGNIFDKEVLNAYYNAEKILLGNDKINRRGCDCQYNRVQQQIDRLYKQFLDNEKIYFTG